MPYIKPRSFANPRGTHQVPVILAALRCLGHSCLRSRPIGWGETGAFPSLSMPCPLPARNDRAICDEENFVNYQCCDDTNVLYEESFAPLKNTLAADPAATLRRLQASWRKSSSTFLCAVTVPSHSSARQPTPVGKCGRTSREHDGNARQDWLLLLTFCVSFCLLTRKGIRRSFSLIDREVEIGAPTFSYYITDSRFSVRRFRDYQPLNHRGDRNCTCAVHTCLVMNANMVCW